MGPLYKANFRRHRSDPEEGPEADSEKQCFKMYCNQIRDEIKLESHTTITIFLFIIILLLLLLPLPPPPPPRRKVVM